jgi:hypothetical protein
MYKIITKEYGIITFEKNELTFDEAYNLATPDYTRSSYPNNHWHIMMKYPVYKFFEEEKNNSITVSYETENKNSDIKIKEFILYKY